MKRTRVKEQERKAKEQSNNRLTGGSEKGSRKDYREEEMEVVPPKIVAMHRVRWNVNKGGEKWLCSGGAAGLVRCQEVDFSTFY